MEFEVRAALTPTDREALLARCEPRHYRRGELIVVQGAPAEHLHLIEQGKVAVRVLTESGEVVTVSVLRAGQFLGEMAVVGRGPRTASAVALEPVLTRSMSAAAFDALRTEQPSVDRMLVEMLAARVDRLSRQLAEVLYLPVEVRLARRLLSLAGAYSTGPGAVEVPLTQEDLAGLVGTTRPTTNQLLQSLAERGVVTLGRGRITVLDLATLRAAAEPSA
jgi:CRP-like cAMP-binding protein